MLSLTGDPGDEPQGPQDSERSEGFHVKAALLFHWRLDTADVIDEVHHNCEQPKGRHTVGVCVLWVFLAVFREWCVCLTPSSQ